MVKVTRDQVIANREALVDAAGQLFRLHGIDGVGVADLCKAAGLTHGALYSQFGSKDELAVEAFAQGQSASRKRMTAVIGEAPDPAPLIDFYVSARQRDNLSNCCPMLASASEAARQGKAFKASYASAFEQLSGVVQAALDKGNAAEEENLGLVVAASMIGVVAVARALKAQDAAASDALIEAARAAFKRLAASPASSSGKRKSSLQRTVKR